MSRKITYARLHDGVFVPGVGDLGKILPPNGDKTLSKCDMFAAKLGLHLVGIRAALNFEVLVPWATVAHAVLVPGEPFEAEEPKQADTKKVTSVQKNSSSNSDKSSSS